VLDGLEDIPWAKLRHAFGSASDVPSLLRSVASPDAQVRSKALAELWNNIWHQGTVYEATPYALPFLIGLLQREDHPDRASVACLIASIIAGRGYYEVHSALVVNAKRGEFADEIEHERAIVAEVQRVGVDALPELLPFLIDSDPDVRGSVAEALACYPSRVDDFVPLLQRALSVEEDDWTRDRIHESLERIRCHPDQ
jgi:HEAT repeat protein